MERKQPIPNQHIWEYLNEINALYQWVHSTHIWEYLNEINALYQWVHSTYKITLSEITITGFRTEITDLLKSSPSLEWICFWGTSTLTWHGGLFEVLVLYSCRLKFSRRPRSHTQTTQSCGLVESAIYADIQLGLYGQPVDLLYSVSCWEKTTRCEASVF